MTYVAVGDPGDADPELPRAAIAALVVGRRPAATVPRDVVDLQGLALLRASRSRAGRSRRWAAGSPAGAAALADPASMTARSSRSSRSLATGFSSAGRLWSTRANRAEPLRPRSPSRRPVSKSVGIVATLLVEQLLDDRGDGVVAAAWRRGRRRVRGGLVTRMPSARSTTSIASIRCERCTRLRAPRGSIDR